MSKDKDLIETEDDFFSENDLITVIDDDGREYVFEELDRIELDNGKKYIAVVQVPQNDDEVLTNSNEMIVLEVIEKGGENYLLNIEDEETEDEVGKIFIERLSEEYGFEFDEEE
ncbi:MAG: DUF1292 domain-containing protein [Clostridia bacterium]|nr:DUF1292 domain-containing protein [Clostridia bacterium]